MRWRASVRTTRLKNVSLWPSDSWTRSENRAGSKMARTIEHAFCNAFDDDRENVLKQGLPVAFVIYFTADFVQHLFELTISES